MITPLQARSVDYLQVRAKDLGLGISFHTDNIRIYVVDKKAYPGMVEEAVLAKALSVEEAFGVITGLSVAFTYTPLWERERQKSARKKSRSTGK